jgi:hypothetical protein
MAAVAQETIHHLVRHLQVVVRQEIHLRQIGAVEDLPQWQVLALEAQVVPVL